MPVFGCLDSLPAYARPVTEVQTECRRGRLLAKAISRNGRYIDAEFAASRKSAQVRSFLAQCPA